jgi:hypothetical protein
VEKLTRYRTRIGAIPTESPRSTSFRSVASILLLAERTSVSRRSSSTDAILRMATTSTRCGWALFEQHSMERRSVFYSWGCVHNSHLWAWDNPHAIRERGYQVHFSVSVWAGIVGYVVVGPYLLPDRLTPQRYRDFLETVLSGLLEYVSLVVRQRLWFHTTELQHSTGKMSSVVERDISRKVYWTCSTDCTAFSVAGSNSDGFLPVGTPKGESLRSPSQDYRRSRGKTSSSCDNSRC